MSVSTNPISKVPISGVVQQKKIDGDIKPQDKDVSATEDLASSNGSISTDIEEEIDFLYDLEDDTEEQYSSFLNNPFGVDKSDFKKYVTVDNNNFLHLVDETEVHDNYQKQKSIDSQIEELHWITQSVYTRDVRIWANMQDNNIVNTARKSFSFSAANAYAETHKVMKGKENEYC